MQTTTTLRRRPAAPHPALRPFLALWQPLRRWRDAARIRRDCAAMLSMPDHTLYDIGLTRHEILEAMEGDLRPRRRPGTKTRAGRDRP